MNKLFVDNLQRVGAAALGKLLAVLESKLFGDDDELADFRLEAWSGPDDARYWLLQTLIHLPSNTRYSKTITF